MYTWTFFPLTDEASSFIFGFNFSYVQVCLSHLWYRGYNLISLIAHNTMLFVHGADDVVYKPPPDQQREILHRKLEAMNNTSLREKQRIETAELEKCQHYAQHEQPEALAKEILEFVERNMLLWGLRCSV